MAASNPQVGEILQQSGGFAVVSDEVRTLASHTRIATAAEAQSAVAEEIKRAAVNISNIAEETAGHAQRATDANDRLAAPADQWRALTARFKL
jgi:methyl-accepting chemotaxis protein